MTDLTPLQTLGLFAGIPVAMFLLLTLLVVAPSWAKDARYRPGLPWTAEPVWFEGPGSVGAAGEWEENQGQAPQAEPTRGGGGASAGW